MAMTHLLRNLAFIGLTLLAGTNSVAASETCLDNNNLVCITETLDEQLTNELGANVSRYSVTNNSDKQIFAFAVTNAKSDGAFFDDGFTGWDQKTLEKGQWNAGSYIGFSSNSLTATWLTGTNGNGYTPLGSFESVFGDLAEENFVNIYWNKYNENPLTVGKTLDAFLFYGVPASNFVAFDVNGSEITSSLSNVNVAAVPEPSEYAMLVAGIAFILLTRQRKAASQVTYAKSK